MGFVNQQISLGSTTLQMLHGAAIFTYNLLGHFWGQSVGKDSSTKEHLGIFSGGSDLEQLVVSIFPISSLFNGEPFGATNGVSQPPNRIW